MKISKKAYYGLRSVLALAERGGEFSVRELALTENMPEEYLHKILQGLRKASLVVSEKGVEGGYTLAKPPCDISVWDIVSVLDSEFKTFSPPRLSESSPHPKLTHCQTNLVWRKLNQSIEDTLSKLKVSDLTRLTITNNQNPITK